MHSSLEERGFATIPAVLGSSEIEGLCQALDGLQAGDEIRRRGGTYGVRNLLCLSREVRVLAADDRLRRLVAPLLGPHAFAVRATYFDKIPGANWMILWHQDSMITVRERREVKGFGPWSEKSSVMHVQPPIEVMERMLALRVHLDDSTEANGALKVLPGSHRHGWLDQEIQRWKSEVPAVTCEVERGGVLALRPLLLHASSRATRPSHRRVIHIEYAADDLPGGLEWHDRV